MTIQDGSCWSGQTKRQAKNTLVWRHPELVWFVRHRICSSPQERQTALDGTNSSKRRRRTDMTWHTAIRHGRQSFCTSHPPSCTHIGLSLHRVARWCNGKAFGLAISRSPVQILLEATLRNNLRQVVYTYVPLSPSSITWYRPKGGDALRLGR